jgi:hypothetical protein
MHISNNELVSRISGLNLCTFTKIEIPNNTNLLLLDSNNNEASEFNKSIQGTRNGNIWGFLPKNCTIKKSNIQYIIDVFDKMGYINYIYSDGIVNGQHIYYPSYPTNNSPIFKQSPLFIRNPIDLFNSSLNHLYFYHMLLILEQRCLGLHIARPLYTITNHQTPTEQEVQQELGIIYGQSNS